VPPRLTHADCYKQKSTDKLTVEALVYSLKISLKQAGELKEQLTDYFADVNKVEAQQKAYPHLEPLFF